MDKPMRLVSGLAAILLSISAFAATEVELEPANNDPDDIESLQRGARNFMN